MDNENLNSECFNDYYKSIKTVCEKNIVKYNETFIESTENSLVKDAIKELIRLNCDGKYLRAFLIALAYHTYSNKKDDYYIPLSMAYETFQTSVLIHDDIIDKADYRRGKETIPVNYKKRYSEVEDREHFSNSMAICIGDLGYFNSYKIIANSYKDNKNIALILETYSDILINTVKGEILDVELPVRSEYNLEKNTLEDSVMEIYKLKTADYSIVGPFKLGMILAGKEDNKMLKLMENIGIAFQIKDDLLGIYSSEEETGKTGTDIQEFKQTILYAYISDKKAEYKDELLKYYGKDNPSTKDVEKVKNIFIESGAKEYAEDMMNSLFLESENKLDYIDIDEEKKSIIRGFITYLKNREK